MSCPTPVEPHAFVITGMSVVGSEGRYPPRREDREGGEGCAATAHTATALTRKGNMGILRDAVLRVGYPGLRWKAGVLWVRYPGSGWEYII